jgi:hypothetical protein
MSYGFKQYVEKLTVVWSGTLFLVVLIDYVSCRAEAVQKGIKGQTVWAG